MYTFQIIHSNQGHIVQMLVTTSLVNPFKYEGLIIEKNFGTDSILINGEKYQVPVNRISHVDINETTSVSFGYFLLEE